MVCIIGDTDVAAIDRGENVTVVSLAVGWFWGGDIAADKDDDAGDGNEFWPRGIEVKKTSSIRPDAAAR